MENLLTNYKKIKDFINGMKCEDETPIPIMYLIQALYPEAFKQFRENFRQQYTKGYIQGRKDEKDESKRNC